MPGAPDPARQADVVIVGGGAAGLSAAIFAAEEARARGAALAVLVVDGARRLGAKILVSGGGRCNVTHRVVDPRDFNGPRVLIRNILATFGVEETVAWFRTLGVPLKHEETGKLFPASDDARTVLDGLLARCRELGVRIVTSCRAAGFEREGPSVRLDDGSAIVGRRVILCAGGMSLPKSGSDGSGYALAREAGHSVTKTFPALVPLTLDAAMFHAAMRGVSHPVELTLRCAGKVTDRRSGELLWTHFGISGPVVLDMSRHWVVAHAGGLAPRLFCSFFPEASETATRDWLIGDGREHPQRTLVRILAHRVPERIGAALVAWSGIPGDRRMGSMSREERATLVATLHALELPVTGTRGWSHAEVTAGGVPLEEVDYRTMESRRLPGLHLAGEILDVDGRVGGFNFQWAWTTGRLAGRSAVRALVDS